LERFRAVEYVLRNRCIKHKAKQDNPEHQPTIYTKCDADYSKEDPDLRCRAYLSQTLSSFLISDSTCLRKLGKMCLFAPSVSSFCGM
jgi:hypothetical protein